MTDADLDAETTVDGPFAGRVILAVPDYTPSAPMTIGFQGTGTPTIEPAG